MRFILTLLFIFIELMSVAQSKQVKQWAQYDRYILENKAILKSPDVVFIGNSITYNWAKFVPDFFKKNNYVGRGISGQTTEQILARFRQDVVDLSPKVVVILAGINDIAQNNGPISNENILGNIKSMCDIAIANEIIPVLCSILPCDYFSWRKDLHPTERIIELNKMISIYAKNKKLKYVDYYSSMATADGALNPNYTEDRCHPTVGGYKIMMPIIQNVLNELLQK